MSDINCKSDGLMHDNDSENKIAALKEKLKNNHSGVRLNGSNGNGAHSSNKIDFKEQNFSKIANVDNGIEIKRIGKHTNSHLNLKHTNGTSSINPAETTLRNVENNITAQSTTNAMVKKTGMSYEEDEESIDDEEMDDSSPDRTNDMSENDDDEEDIEEVKDSDSDSDIMEVDAEDSIDPPGPSKSSLKEDLPKTSVSSGQGKTNVVTIDDMKTLKALADSTKINKQKQDDKTNANLAEANRIIAGRQSGGVTITPAVRNLPPGLTISQSRSNTSQSLVPNGGKLSLPAGISVSPANLTQSNLASVPSHKITDQLNDPNLTDDTFVVEAPSFIVPYVYEKPPKETIKDFKLSIKKIEDNVKKETEDKKEIDSESAKSDENKSDNPETSKDKSSENDDEKNQSSKTDSSSEVQEVKKDASDISQKKTEFFDSSLGKLFYELGMNLVQETVQKDLLVEQQRKARKDKSAAVMHAIMSLKANIEQSKERNQAFEMELKKCKFCSFRTESLAVLDHHMETPHMKGSNYRCNVCKLELRTAQEVTSHMFVEHGVRARLERAAAIHQCPQCPFEDNQKGKLTRHKVGCDKRFRAERNQEPPHDWEPPAKIPKPAVLPHQKYQHNKNMLPNMHGLTAQQQLVQQMAARGQAGYSALQQQQLQMQLASAGMKQMPPLQQMGFRSKGHGANKNNSQAFAHQMRQAPVLQDSFETKKTSLKLISTKSSLTTKIIRDKTHDTKQSKTPIVSINSSLRKSPKPSQLMGFRIQSSKGDMPSLLANINYRSSIMNQSIGSRSTNKSSHSPSISITPLPGGRSQSSTGGKAQGHMQSMKPGQPGNNQGRGFVICEVCDGYIKDMEQLRNHMQWIHKVKIHPKMIHNRPPLNCQKCQCRFFTDQGLERHLLGTHGLVTASMQDLANKGQDSGRCPVCGKVYQWKLLNHVAKDHMKVLKPAHLSYKCTVCTATFGQYKLFENHVYTVHSGAKRGNNASSSKASGSSQTNPKQPIKVSDEITIIPQKKNTPTSSNTTNKSGMTWSSSLVAAQADAAQRKSEASNEDPDIIDLDDEEEIDDDEPQKTVQHSSGKTGIEISKVAPSKLASDPLELKRVNKSSNGEPTEKKSKLNETLNESADGVEQIEEIDDDED